MYHLLKLRVQTFGRALPREAQPLHRTKANNSSRRQQLRSVGWLVLAMAVLFLTMLAQQSNAEPGTGEMIFRTEDGTQQQAMALETDVKIDVKGINAQATVKQRFTNTTDEWVEAVYVFPLPETAAVNAFQMAIGERIIKGVVQEKTEAEKTYNAAKSAGKKAALVQQERPNLFTQSVANIGPGESVVVELSYLQAIIFDAGTFSLRFPLTLTPRYIPGAPLPAEEQDQRLTVGINGWAMPTDQVPDANRITPRYRPPGDSGHTINLTVSLSAGLPITYVQSRSHAISIQQEKVAQRVTLHEGVRMDRDFELEWRTASSAQASAAVFTETFDGAGYLQLMLLPPQVKTSSTFPRELVLVIDTSGSMQGTSIEQARRSLLWALDRLRPEDTFNVIAFQSFHTMLFEHPVQATPQNIHYARTFVKHLHADGGTEMAPALEAALAGTETGNMKQIVFITDGSVGNESALFALIRNRLNGARLFPVGIGSAPNSYFMRKAAQFGRGTFTHIGRVEDVEEKMGALFDKIESPVVADITVQWPGDAEMYPAVTPDLYLGEPLLVTAKLPEGINAGDTLVISGKTQGQPWRRELLLQQAAAQADDKSGIVATQWARQKISALLDEKIAGEDPQQIREQVLEVALPFQLMSPYTSFVAVEQTPSRPPEAPLSKQAVHNELPAGQSAPALMYPQTATPASLNILLGLMSLALVIVVRQGLRHG